MKIVAQDTLFVSGPIPDAVFLRMQGKSYPQQCSVTREELAYLQLSYQDFTGKTQLGEMICNKAIATDLVDIFRELWKADYRIERMQLIDDYNANDTQSMEANNTSSFCYRTVAGSSRISKHGRGMAVDINPLYNPHVTSRDGKMKVNPVKGKPYAYNRDSKVNVPYLIRKGDLCYRLFIAHGFKWGGDWRSSKDYQHFEK